MSYVFVKKVWFKSKCIKPKEVANLKKRFLDLFVFYIKWSNRNVN